MKARGGIEFGKSHYRYMVLGHSLFFIGYIIEVNAFGKNISPAWPMLLLLFLITQAGRLWALLSLGRFWNTKIIVVPQANVVKRGPYRFLKHPNYVVVAMEFIVIPLLFQAYLTAIVFSILNFLLMLIRIPLEEKALAELTDYESQFGEEEKMLALFFKKV